MKQVDPYADLNINGYGVLKPPLLLWLIMLIETWHCWSSVFVAFSGQNWLFAKGYDWMNFVVEAPAVLVMLALSARLPKAGKVVRAIWHRGRELLTVAAIGNLVVVVIQAFQIESFRFDSQWSALLMSFLHLWVIARIWVSSIVKQVFSEFPV